MSNSSILTDNTNMAQKFQLKVMNVGFEGEEVALINLVLAGYEIENFPLGATLEDIEDYELVIVSLEAAQFLKLSKPKPVIIIAEDRPETAKHFLARPIDPERLVRMVRGLIGYAQKPEVQPINIGAIVKSKTTPHFGKGVVTKIYSEHEVFVKFPMAKELANNKLLKCHVSHLSLIGYVDKNNNVVEIHGRNGIVIDSISASRTGKLV